MVRFWLASSAGPSPAAEAAFEALIQRHGPMVARVCGGILGDHHTAEDAVQAVFLVLARRARSIRDPDRLAPWLYGVALRTAREARRRHLALPTLAETTTMIDTGSDPTQSLIRREQAELLHRAIARLPGRYLAPVILCDLEGLTHAEAASQLNCPVSTVSIRLQRARAQLRTRLARHRLDFESALPPVAVGHPPDPGGHGHGPRPGQPSPLDHDGRPVESGDSWRPWSPGSSPSAPRGIATIAPLRAVTRVAGRSRRTRPELARPPRSAGTAPRRPSGRHPRMPVGFPTVRDVVDYQEYSGHVAASRTARSWLRPRGIISQAKVAEGDLVRAEQVLFRPCRRQSRDHDVARLDWQAMLKDRPGPIRSSERRSPGDPPRLPCGPRRMDLQERTRQIDGKIPSSPRSMARSPRWRWTWGHVEAGKTRCWRLSSSSTRCCVDFAMDEQTFLTIQRWLQTRPGDDPPAGPVRLATRKISPPRPSPVPRARSSTPATGTCTLHAELPNADRALIPGLFRPGPARIRRSAPRDSGPRSGDLDGRGAPPRSHSPSGSSPTRGSSSNARSKCGSRLERDSWEVKSRDRPHHETRPGSISLPSTGVKQLDAPVRTAPPQ